MTTNWMTHDKERDEYAGEIRLRITVPGELYRRAFNQQISESPGLDLSSSEAVEALRAKLADPLYWRGKPQATTIELPVTPLSSPFSPPFPKQEKQKQRKPQKGAYAHYTEGTLYDHLRAQVPAIPPHLWEETLLEAMPPELQVIAKSKEEQKELRRRRQSVHNHNNRARTFLIRLKRELDAGVFILTSEAKEKEEEYQQGQQGKVMGKTTALALLTNNSRLVGNFVTSTNGAH